MFEYTEIMTVAIPLMVAAAAGGLIGLEREYRSKSAGFRTMILIAVGSCLFTMLSVIIGGDDKEASRIAASVVSGVGFLGAGVILRDGVTIRGLTTAASVWLAASLGMAAGVSEYGLVAVVTVLALVVLLILPLFERLLSKLSEYATFKVTIKNSDAAEDNILDILDECKVNIVTLHRSILNKGERTLHLTLKLSQKRHRELSEILVNEKGILKIEY